MCSVLLRLRLQEARPAGVSYPVSMSWWAVIQSDAERSCSSRLFFKCLPHNTWNAFSPCAFVFGRTGVVFSEKLPFWIFLGRVGLWVQGSALAPSRVCRMLRLWRGVFGNCSALLLKKRHIFAPSTYFPFPPPCRPRGRGLLPHQTVILFYSSTDQIPVRNSGVLQKKHKVKLESQF